MMLRLSRSKARLAFVAVLAAAGTLGLPVALRMWRTDLQPAQVQRSDLERSVDSYDAGVVFLSPNKSDWAVSHTFVWPASSKRPVLHLASLSCRCALAQSIPVADPVTESPGVKLEFSLAYLREDREEFAVFETGLDEPAQWETHLSVRVFPRIAIRGSSPVQVVIEKGKVSQDEELIVVCYQPVAETAELEVIEPDASSGVRVNGWRVLKVESQDSIRKLTASVDLTCSQPQMAGGAVISHPARTVIGFAVGEHRLDVPVRVTQVPVIEASPAEVFLQVATSAGDETNLRLSSDQVFSVRAIRAVPDVLTVEGSLEVPSKQHQLTIRAGPFQGPVVEGLLELITDHPMEPEVIVPFVVLRTGDAGAGGTGGVDSIK